MALRGENPLIRCGVGGIKTEGSNEPVQTEHGSEEDQKAVGKKKNRAFGTLLDQPYHKGPTIDSGRTWSADFTFGKRGPMLEACKRGCMKRLGLGRLREKSA